MKNLCAAALLAATASLVHARPQTTTNASDEDPSFVDQLRGEVPSAISGNPSAVYDIPGSGMLGRFLRVPEDRGLWVGGVWVGNANGLLSGGAEPGKWSWNSLLIAGFNIDAEKLMGWEGASFGIQFLQFNGEDTNGQAGAVQGYNSLPGPFPLDRSQLYQLWYRQALFDDRISIRIGKLVPTYEFNNVLRPVSTSREGLEIPSVSGLLFTPVFVNPTLLGAIGGYYNSVSGLTVSVAPTKNTYLRYGFFDGNVAAGAQTGMMGPQFNGYFFNIWEAGMDWILAKDYPGNFGAGLWYQSGTLEGPPGVSQTGTGGFYLFGSQRIWGNRTGRQPAKDGKSALSTTGPKEAPASISLFYQYGINNSETLPVNQYFGMGVAGFGFVPHRPHDSLGLGMAWSWLNPEIFDRPSELMFQGYYQAQVTRGVFASPSVSYIPTPGASPDLGGAWALTFQMTVLF